MRGRILVGDGIADALRQLFAERDILVAREFDKAAGKIGIAGRERGLDVFAAISAGLFRRAELSLQIGQFGRIVLRRQDGKGVARMRPQRRTHRDSLPPCPPPPN